MNPSKKLVAIEDFSLSQAAKIAGFGLLFMFIFGLIASDPQITASFDDLKASTRQIRLNIVGDVMLLVSDVVAALGLYVFLKPVNRSLSLLTAWFRLMHVAIYGASLLALLLIVYLLSGAESLAEYSIDDLKAQVNMLIHSYESGFRIGLTFFGFHILLLGYLIIKSKYIPNILGILLLIVSVGYLINSLAGFLIPNYGDFATTIQIVVYVPAIIAELSLCLWLLFKGSKVSDNPGDGIGG